MEKLYTNIVGTPIVEDNLLRPVALVRDVVIDPENGKLVALITDIRRNLIVVPVDILAWGRAIAVRRDSIIEGCDVIRVDEVQKKEISIFQNRVETKSGDYVGIVMDFSLNSKTLCLKKLYTAKGFLGLIRYDSRIITSKNIIKILPEKIIINNDLEVVIEDEKVAIEDFAAT